jgi:hypothetical protein
MSAQWRTAAAAGLVGIAAFAGSAEAGDYPLSGITAFVGENEIAGYANDIKSKVDGLIGGLAKFGATPVDFAKPHSCFFGFAKASSDGTIVTYQIDVDATEAAMEAKRWPVPVAYKEVARTTCVHDPAANADTCTDPDGSKFALVYFDQAHMDFGYLRDPKDIAAASANPASLTHDHIIDCSASAQFLESHIAPGQTEMRTDVRALVLGYFVGRVATEPDFAKAIEAFFAAKQ